MQVRRLKIENFRGIKFLDWTLPVDQKLITLVGPGDSGESTTLVALNFLLGDRWNIPFSDTDFFEVDTSQTIRIAAILTGIPKPLLKESALGLWLRGLHKDGSLTEDPEDETEPALTIQLVIGGDLEPSWEVYKSGRTQRLTSNQRREFSTFLVDERTDAQLRWSRTSALGRLSATDGADRSVLAEASRAAQTALQESENSSLLNLSKKVQERVNGIGGGVFQDIKPGLDTSRSSLGAGLALYDGSLPLASYGLGSRRLASLAIQQMAAGDRSIAIMDEIESGLEPHRAVNLLRYLQNGQGYSQVFITTHAPIIVEQADLESLSVAQNEKGQLRITSLAGSRSRLRALRRSRPSSFLGKKILICEGKTEYGLIQACVNYWDEGQNLLGEPVAAGRGFVLQDGAGGSEVALRCQEMINLGFQVAGLLDHDDSSVQKAVNKALSAGVLVLQWDQGNNTESQVCSALSWRMLEEFIRMGADCRSDDLTVLADLQKAGLPQEQNSLELKSWQESGLTIEVARDIVARAANESEWFKNIESGMILGKWLTERSDSPELKSLWAILNRIQEFIYSENAEG
ncbi:TPA: ATP-binding protein [Corynebacterium striatum]|nr:ATP-binding protein [Corynebacterium striatum]